MKRSSSLSARLLLALCCVCAFLLSTAEAGSCTIFDENLEDVTVEHYDEVTKMVNCTGDRVCAGYTMDGCESILCKGVEACNSANITGVTSQVQCLETKACHYTSIHAVPGSEDANALCEGSNACDVTKMTNFNQVVCTGSNGCRKARIHANMVQCTHGGERYDSCSFSATLIVKDCLYCGKNGCARVYNGCRYRNSDEEVASDYWDKPWEEDEWESCPTSSEIVGECTPEWQIQYDEEQLEAELDQGGEEGS